MNFGAFVRVEEGLEGLIHISELSNQRVAHPGDVVKEGEPSTSRSSASTPSAIGWASPSSRPRSGLAPSRHPPGRAPSARARRRPDSRSGRPRRERGGRDRRDRDYRPEDAISEPDEGIDNTMAAAFARSGLLDQLRSRARGGRGAEAEAVACQGSRRGGRRGGRGRGRRRRGGVAEEPVAIEVDAAAEAEAPAAEAEPEAADRGRRLQQPKLRPMPSRGAGCRSRGRGPSRTEATAEPRGRGRAGEAEAEPAEAEPAEAARPDPSAPASGVLISPSAAGDPHRARRSACELGGT